MGEAVFPLHGGAHSGLPGAVSVICWCCTCSHPSSVLKGHTLTTGQGCSAVAAAQLLIKGKSNLLTSLKSADLASGFLFDLEKMRHC